MTKSEPEAEAKVEKPQFTQEQLREALFHVQDVFERAMCPFFVLGNTAKHIVSNEEEFVGDEDIHVGVRQAALTREVVGMMRSYIPDLVETKVQFSYFHNKIPIIIDIIHGDYEVFKNPDMRYYYISEFLIPNPWKQYWQQHEFIK
jgi:hypothetical protein